MTLRSHQRRDHHDLHAAQQSCRLREPVLFDTASEPDLTMDQLSDEHRDGNHQNEDFSEAIDEKDFIARFITRLTPREERIIRLRFGLGCIGEHTLETAGNELGCGRERIRQIESKALRKLRFYAKRTYPSRMVHDSTAIAESRTHPYLIRKPKPGGSAHAVRPSQAAASPAPIPKHISLNKQPRSAGSDRAVQQRRGHALVKAPGISLGANPRALLTRLLWPLAWLPCGIAASLCALCWAMTLGEAGKALFTEQFGHGDGPLIRLLTWSVCFGFGPLLGIITVFSFEDWRDPRRRQI